MSGTYERLSHLDTSFLSLESRSTHMHVAALATFEAAPLTGEDGGIDIDRVRDFVESKLHLIPRYRQRLAWVPYEQHPVWVDDEHFNIGYHVRHSSLPVPGDDRQLVTLVGRLISQQLDRSKPLWEMYVVEGVADGRIALVSKTHHAVIDGISGVDIMAVLLGMAPTDDFTEGPPFVARPAPEGSELFIRETARRVGSVLGSLRSLTEVTKDVKGNVQAVAFDTFRKVRAVGYSLRSGWLSQSPESPLNGTVGPNRRFATLTIPLNEVKAVKNALGGSVNDVVLATVAGAVRRYVAGTEESADLGEFRVMAPVSVRLPGGGAGSLGNQVAMWLVTLPVDEPDPVQRLAAVTAETKKLKLTDQALGASTLVRLSAGAPNTLVALASRLAHSVNMRPFNMTVTNVPGPQFPLYLLGARMLSVYPLVPLWVGHGAGIALFSYAGNLHWGFNTDWDVIPDPQVLVDAVAASFDELKQAAASAAAGTTKPAKEAGDPKPKARPPLGTPGKPKARPPLGTPAKEQQAVAPEEEADPPGLDELLADLKPDRHVAEAVREASRLREVVATFVPDSGYISLKPSGGGAIACYVHRSRVAVAFPAETASEEAEEVPGADVQARKTGAHFVRVPEDAIGESFDSVVDLMVRSIDWRAGTPPE